jgi:hypothetical protein
MDRTDERIELEIRSRDFWVKLVDMLQQNWALIDESGAECTVFFVHDASGVFDRISFQSSDDATKALSRNGFRRYTDNPDFKDFIRPPDPPYYEAGHPNGPIYSSGRYWR